MTPTTNGMPHTAADTAAYLLSRGYAPLPLPSRMKKPVMDGWTKFRLTPETINDHFPAGAEMNVGNLNGEPSGGLVDVDLDCPEARRAAPYLLPETGMMSGRRSAPDNHWWYVTDDPPAKASTEFNDPTDTEDALLVELRSTGGQTLLPPSVYPADPRHGHPEPEPCVWHKHGEAARVPVAELQAAVEAVAAAALLACHWKTRRHAKACALSGGLLRAGWPVDRVERFLTAVAAAARDEEPDNRTETAADTAAKLAAGENVTGWPTLEKELGVHGKPIVSTLTDWLDIRPASAAVIGAEPEQLPWPAPPHDAAYHGLAGELVRVIEPASEADPAALLAQTLIGFGSLIGRTAYFRVEAVRHYTNEYLVITGGTAGGRKGTSREQVHRELSAAERLADCIRDEDLILGDTSWAGSRNQSGLSSAEGLIWAVRGPIEKQERIKERGSRSGTRRWSPTTG